MAIKLAIYNQRGEIIEEMEAPAEVFGVKTNSALIHQAVSAQLGNERQILAHTKDRSEVRGGGRKPWRQKGTGRARHGSIRSPLWVGGGVTFGPTKERRFGKDINRKMKQKALLMVLSDKIAHKRCAVIDRVELDGFETKKLVGVVEALEKKALAAHKEKAGEGGKKKAKRSLLMVNTQKDDKIAYSGRNIAGLTIINFENINIVDIIKRRDLVLSKEAVTRLADKYAGRAKSALDKEK